MTPPDWSWGESHRAPTLVAVPHPLLISDAFISTEHHQISDYPSCCRQAYTIQPPPTPNFQPPSTRQFPTILDSRAESITHRPPPTSTAGRKRSCHEISSDTEEGVKEARPITPRAAPIYGPGMTLIYPDHPSTSAVDAASQTGTWVEDRVFRSPLSSVAGAVAARPQLEPRKSRRLTNKRDTEDRTDID